MDSSWRKNYLRYKSFFLNTVTQYRERSDWKAYLEIILSLATISVFSVFALKPTIVTIAELIKQIGEKKQVISQMDAKIQNISKAQILADQQRNNITLLKSYAVPTSSSPEVFARQAEGLSAKYQVPLYSLNLGKSRAAGKSIQSGSSPDSAEEMNFTINYKVPAGQYPLLTELLGDSNILRRPIKFSRIELGVEELKTEDDKQIYLLLEGKLPYLPETNL